MNNIESENLYIVEVTETSQRLVVVRANSKEEAVRETKNRYERGTLSLGDLDVVDSSIEIYNYEDPTEMDSLLETHFENEDDGINTEKMKRILENLEKYRNNIV